MTQEGTRTRAAGACEIFAQYSVQLVLLVYGNRYEVIPVRFLEVVCKWFFCSM
jgi:hypothetical protein